MALGSGLEVESLANGPLNIFKIVSRSLKNIHIGGFIGRVIGAFLEGKSVDTPSKVGEIFFPVDFLDINEESLSFIFGTEFSYFFDLLGVEDPFIHREMDK